MTMASSTTKPVEIVSAMSDRLSRLYPSRYMTPNVPMSESGTATLGIAVARRLRKNTKITPTTRPMVSSERELHVFDRRAHGLGAVAESTFDLDALRQRRLQLRQERLHPVGDLDDVRARLALDVENDGALVVGPAGELRVLHAVDDVRDVARAAPARRSCRRE